MIKVGEHITLDFLGVKKEYSKSFYEKIIYNLNKHRYVITEFFLYSLFYT